MCIVLQGGEKTLGTFLYEACPRDSLSHGKSVLASWDSATLPMRHGQRVDRQALETGTAKGALQEGKKS